MRKGNELSMILVKKKRFFPLGSKVQRVKRNHLLGAIVRGAGEFWGGFYLTVRDNSCGVQVW